MIVQAELYNLRKFGEFLRAEDKEVFEDLLRQCQLYASFASTMASPVKEVPLIISMLFGQHKILMDLSKRLVILESQARDRKNRNTLQSKPTVGNPSNISMASRRRHEDMAHFTPGQIQRALDSEKSPTTHLGLMDPETMATCQRYIEQPNLLYQAAKQPTLKFTQKATLLTEARVLLAKVDGIVEAHRQKK